MLGTVSPTKRTADLLSVCWEVWGSSIGKKELTQLEKLLHGGRDVADGLNFRGMLTEVRLMIGWL